MFRLLEIILFTPDVGRLRAFYEEQVGLETEIVEDHWTSFHTRGARLALHPAEGKSRLIELTFETPDIEAAAEMLRARGARFSDEIRTESWGRIVHLHGPEGHLLALEEPNEYGMRPAGETIDAAVIHVEDLPSARAFFSAVMGLPVRTDEPWWVDFDTGETALALHPRIEPEHAEKHRGGGITFRFAMPDLNAWASAARARGLRFATPPTDEGAGRFAVAVDPDGNEMAFHDAASTGPVLEEQLAEAYEDDGVLRQASIRKPVKKASKAVSRVAVKPAYHSKRRPPRRRPSATTREVSSVRGAGPERTRLKPKRTGDEKKARAKPATGRLKKAEQRSQKSHSGAVARASKARPLKRKAARSARRK